MSPATRSRRTAFYNRERPHQALRYRTPDEVHADGVGGDASIPDYYRNGAKSDVATASTTSSTSTASNIITATAQSPTLRPRGSAVPLQLKK